MRNEKPAFLGDIYKAKLDLLAEVTMVGPVWKNVFSFERLTGKTVKF